MSGSTAEASIKRRPRWRRWAVRIVVDYLILLAIGFVLMWAGLANHFLLFPTTAHEDPLGAELQHIPFGKGQLCVYVARSPGCRHTEPSAFDLELMGNGSRAEGIATPVAMKWGDRPVEVWALNYPGYGNSTGPASLKEIAPSASAAYDAVSKIAAGRPILLGSHSLGTAAALYVAAHRPVAGIVLLNPPALRQLIVGHYGWWNAWLGAIPAACCIPSELDSLQNARLDHAPAIFISGARDRVVPPKYHRQVYEAYAGPKRWLSLPTGEHNTVPDPVTLNEYAAGLDWLWTLVQQPGVPASPAVR